jgi:hypothetical protein
MAFKNIKNHLKTQNQPKNKKKKIHSSYLFLGVLKVKKTRNLNSSHYIELVHTKINDFGSQNLS